MKIRQLSVFFPTVNEEGNIETVVKKAVSVLQSLRLEYEIIVVNDGSSDKTAQIVERLIKQNNRIRIINHPKNLGYGEALKSGFYNAKYDTIVYTDGDGQFDFSEVSKFLEKIDEIDVIVGYRIKRRDPFFRILFKEGWKLSLFTFFRLTLKDIDCGFKMVKKKVLEKISHLESQRGAMINAELVIKAKKAGFKIGQVGVNHYPRISGKPTGANIKVIFKSYLDLVRLWWGLKVEKKYFIAFLLVILLASFFRLYKIDQYMIFLGDEGRDALIIKNMLTELHFPLIGPPTSVGNIYLGPLYYYLMFASMVPFSLSPVAASVMVAFFGIATVGLVYYLGKIWFGRKAGLISSFLYAISPINIMYSTFSWNPNPMPFFALVAFLGLFKAHKSGNFLWLILTGVSLAISLQLHYLGLILIPAIGVLWGYEIFSRGKTIKNLWTGTFLAVIAYLFIMSPLVFFDIRHNYLNYRAIVELFSSSDSLNGNIFTNIIRIPEIFSQNLVGRYIAGQNMLLGVVVSLFVVLSLANRSYPTLLLGVWLVVGLIGISFYQKDVYDHYLGFLNPVPYLLLGSVVASKFAKDRKVLVNIGIIVLIILLTIVNLQKNPLLTLPNNQLQRTQEVAKFVIQKAKDEEFNFALLSKSNYDSAYQFYLSEYGHTPKMVPAEKTLQLFVVCEDPCDPPYSPKYEVAAYGMSKVDWVEEFQGVKIYRLIPNPTGKK